MERSSEVEEIILDWFEAFSTGNGAWFEGHVSRDADVRFIGTDPDDWQEGHHVGEFLKRAVEELNGTVKISPGDALGFRDGNVAWGITRPTLTLPDGKEITLRWSAVFHHQDGQWKAVQIHGSVGVPDEKLIGVKLSG